MKIMKKYGVKREWCSEIFSTKTYGKNFDSEKADEGSVALTDFPFQRHHTSCFDRSNETATEKLWIVNMNHCGEMSCVVRDAGTW